MVIKETHDNRTDEQTGADDPGQQRDTARDHTARSRLGALSARSRAMSRSGIPLKTALTTTLIVALAAGLAVLSWQVHDKSNQAAALRGDSADRSHAEQIALDYATGAATMNFKDLPAWKARLTKNTTPQLSNKLTQAAGSMEQIITPLQWTSTSTPIAAKVRSDNAGLLDVDTFVSVLTKNAQAPDGVQSTATYRLTIDKSHNWTITDVGGIDAALGSK